eukprot:3919666-Prymnesium_polylepis.2
MARRTIWRPPGSARVMSEAGCSSTASTKRVKAASRTSPCGGVPAAQSSAVSRVATPVPRLCPHRSTCWVGTPRCASQRTAAWASSTSPDSEGCPLDDPNPRYSRSKT